LANDRGKAIIGADLIIYGDVRNALEVEVLGSVLGNVDTEHVTVFPSGRLAGALNASTAEVNGQLEGKIRVKGLIDIKESGVVRGDVRYGALALAPGGDLAASVRNLPPELSGDFEMTVRRGQSTMVTPADLSASDAEDGASELTYHVSNALNGYLALGAAPRTAIEQFSQADIGAGRVNFVHDGGEEAMAGFDVLVTDSQGATSGPPRRVTVAVVSPR